MTTASDPVRVDTSTPNQAFYLAQINAYEKLAEPWIAKCRKIQARYADEGTTKKSTVRFNVLWPNIETMRPALYARPPVAYIERRFKDRDPVGAKAAEVLERCISATLEQIDISYLGGLLVRDYLLNARTVSWERYEPVISASAQISGEPEEKLEYEYACTDYLPLEDFGHSAARHWGEVRMVWRRAYLTKEQAKKRFPEKVDSLSFDMKEDPSLFNDETKRVEQRTCVYEVWDKEIRKVCFVAKGTTDVLDMVEPPVKFQGFFPCPRPLYGTLSGKTLIPTPDYVSYEDQSIELDVLTQRISKITSALRVAGAYDASFPALEEILSDTGDNRLVAVDSYAVLAQKGGIEGAVTFLPIKEIAEVLIRLYEARERAKQDLYEKTGIADIIRGATDASETATAQQIKGQFATLRLSERQRDVQRYLRDVIRLKAETISEAFNPETVKAMCGVKLLTQAEKEQAQQVMQVQQQLPPEQQQQLPQEIADLMREPTWEEVFALLKNDPLRTFRIDIETDSTIQVDEQADKQARMEYIAALTNGIKAASEVGLQAPQMLKLMGRALQFGARAFKNARELESVLDEALESVQKQIENPPPPQPDPELVKAEKMLEMKQREHDMNTQLKTQEMEFEFAKSEREMVMKEQMAEREFNLKARQAEHDAQLKERQTESQAAIADMKARQDVELAGFKETARAELAEKALALKNEAPEKEKARDDKLQQVLDAVIQNQMNIVEMLESLKKPRRRRAVVDGETLEIEIEDLH